MRRNVRLKMGRRAMPVWSCLPFPLDRCFQKLHIRNLREKLEGNSYFLTYSLTLFLKVHSGHLWKVRKILFASIKKTTACTINRYQIQILWYTAGWNVCGDWFSALNHHNHKIWIPFILTHNLWLIFTGMKQKIFFVFVFF